MDRCAPLLSVGIPVYNGEDYLEEALHSLINQDYAHVELIIADNASSDRTQEICASFASADTRVKYSRQLKNIGAGANYNFVFHQSRGKYFKWAAHDDLCSPDFFSKCVDVLEKDSSLVLSYPTIVEIDEIGEQIRVLDRNMACSNEPKQRFMDLASWNHNCEEIFGVIRSNILRKTRLIRNYTDSDRTLLVQLGLFGRFCKVSGPAFFHRIHSGMSTRRHKNWRQRATWFNPEVRNLAVISAWKQLLEYILIIAHSELSFERKLGCYVELMRLMKWRYKWLFEELFWGARESLSRGFTRSSP